MKTIRLDRALRELIYEHNCVTVPSFGSFILRESQASANKFTGDIRPSGQTIFFNNAITADDGILANFYRENLGITYSKALEYIQDDTEQIVRSLRERRNFPFGNVGNFFLNAEGKVFFLPSGSLNISKKTFGLNVFRLEELMSGGDPDILFLPHPDLLKHSEKEEPESLIPSHSAEEELQEVEVLEAEPEPAFAHAQPAQDLEERIAMEEAAPIVEEVAAIIEEKPAVSVETPEPPAPEPAPLVEETYTEPVVVAAHKPGQRILLRSAASLLVLLAAGGLYIGAQAYGPGFLKKGAQPRKNIKAGTATAAANTEDRDEAISGTSEDKGGRLLEQDADASLDDAGFMATVITNARTFLAELRNKPGDYYLVGGTYSGEHIALLECMRWKKLGVDATFARVDNSKIMKKVLLGRYTREQDAAAFAAQLPKLDGKELKIQMLNVNY